MIVSMRDRGHEWPRRPHFSPSVQDSSSFEVGHDLVGHTLVLFLADGSVLEQLIHRIEVPLKKGCEVGLVDGGRAWPGG